MRVYLSTLFKKAGYEVDSAVNGEEGIRQAKISRPDLITLDVLMPRKSGIKAYQELRQDAALADIPIVILTGLTQQEDFFGAELGSLPRPQAVCDKPIDRDDFLQKVKDILGD